MKSTLFRIVLTFPLVAFSLSAATALGQATNSDALIILAGSEDPCTTFEDHQSDGPLPSTSAMTSYTCPAPCSGQASASGRSDLASFTLHATASADADGQSILASYASAGAELDDVLILTGNLLAPGLVTLWIEVDGTITGSGSSDYCLVLLGMNCGSISQEGTYFVPVQGSFPVVPGPLGTIIPPMVGLGITLGALADSTSLPIYSDFSAFVRCINLPPGVIATTGSGFVLPGC
jgi:hypothetical protein